MKILVTGGAGFIGSNVVDGLVEQGHKVTVVDNLSSGKKENISQDAAFYRVDIREKKLDRVFAAEKPEVVIHNAAQLSVRVSVEDPLMDADINIMGGLNVINTCYMHGVRKIIFASSGGTVYGEQKYFPADESHPTAPISPYGVAKLATENYLYYFYKVYGLSYIALRYGNIYGPRQDPLGEAGVVAIFSRKLLEGGNPVINGDGLQTRDYTYVGDVVRANIAAVKSDHVGPVNIGNGVETDVVTLFGILKKASGKEAEETHGPAKAGEQRRSVLDSSLARAVLDWEPEIAIEDGLKLTYNWFKRNYKSL
ncbi:MAG: NAD-dependent epimerase/dehydratase family protein [Actinobacteria bacterium]|nr:NAD-dependent epimerase/dehydratase family protein [Actinomycetota bacterium]